MCRGQRATCWSWFSLSVMWIYEIESGHMASGYLLNYHVHPAPPLTKSLLCSSTWSQTPNPPDATSQMLGLQVHDIIPSLYFLNYYFY